MRIFGLSADADPYYPYSCVYPLIYELGVFHLPDAIKRVSVSVHHAECMSFLSADRTWTSNSARAVLERVAHRFSTTFLCVWDLSA
jgi:hypothetical protein